MLRCTVEAGSIPEMIPVSRRLIVVAIALAAALLQQNPGASKPAAPGLPDAAAQVARDFLYAFSRNDRAAIRRMVPTELSNLYGQCPFTQIPRLTKSRVRKRAAAVNFSGRMVDPGLPTNGMIILRRVEQDGERTWRVRQIYWYDELPKDARRVPQRSVTDADRQQEPQVERAAAEFLSAWRAGDYDRMDELTFRWWESDRRRSKWIRLTGTKLRSRPTTLDGLRVDFLAQLRIARIFPRSVRGNIWLVEENGVWRVRPVSLTVQF
jgi:hypothetical protein